jgi:hypothetical protein
MWIDTRPEAIAVVIWVAMSHLHRAGGPCGYSDESGRWTMGSRYLSASYVSAGGDSDQSLTFHAAIRRWASRSLSPSYVSAGRDSDQSLTFDAAVGRWAADSCHQAASLQEARRLASSSPRPCPVVAPAWFLARYAMQWR